LTSKASRHRQDQVFVRGLEFEGNHGYYEEERKTNRRFRVTVEIDTTLGQAYESDALSDTIDYFEVCQTVIDIGTKQTFKLLESLAASIGKALLKKYPQSTIMVEIEKLGPPCPGVPQSCGVRVFL